MLPLGSRATTRAKPKRSLQPPERLRPSPKGPCRRGRGTLRRPVPRRTNPGEPGPARRKHPALELAVSDHRVPLGQATRVLRGGSGHGTEPDPNRRLAGPALRSQGGPGSIHGPSLGPGRRGVAAGKVLTRLDAQCKALGLVGCLDEIFFHGRAVLVGVEPLALSVSWGRRSAYCGARSGPSNCGLETPCNT